MVTSKYIRVKEKVTLSSVISVEQIIRLMHLSITIFQIYIAILVLSTIYIQIRSVFEFMASLYHVSFSVTGKQQHRYL